MKLLKKLRIVYDAYFFNKKVEKRLSEDFFFIQIGACDGKKFDPIYDLVKKHQMAGILVEPVPYLFARLNKNYVGHQNLIFENSAVTTFDGNVNMFTISEDGLKELPPWAIGISSLHSDKNAIGSDYWEEDRAKTLVKNGVDFNLIEKHRVEIEVNAITLNSLLQKHQVKHVDLMVIDAEGHEYNILKQLKDLKVLPKIIRYESFNLKEEQQLLSDLLKGLGYKLKIINKYDTIAWLS